MKKILFVAAGLAFFLTFWISPSNAQMCECMGGGMKGGGMMGGMQHRETEMMPGKHSGMMEGEGPMWKTLMGLDLNEQQKESLKAVRSRVMKEAIRKGAELRIAEIEQKDILVKDPVDMKAVEAKLRQIEMLRTDIHLLFIKAVEEVKSKLTPEQRKKFRDILEKGPMMGGMGMMHGADCGMKGGEECRMMGGMMQRGLMEGEVSQPAEERGRETPAGHKHH